VKIYQVEIIPGNVGKVLAKGDFIRLISTYKLTLSDFLTMGLSRGLWNNTLKYYNINVNDIEGFRLTTPVPPKFTHLRSTSGFSTYIPIPELRPSIKKTDAKVNKMVYRLAKHFPGVINTYAEYHKDSIKVSRYLEKIRGELIDCQLIIRYLNRRIVKWSKKQKISYLNLTDSIFEVHFSKIFKELKIEYNPQFSISPYSYDFYIPSMNLLVEVDGGGHQGKTDAQKTLLAQVHGYELKRFSIKNTHELKQQYVAIKDYFSKKLR